MLTAIKLQSFRSHLDTSIDGLGRLNVFAGPNGSGKSSILDAIVFGLTGACRGAEGRALEELRTQADGKAAKKPATVTLATTHGVFNRTETQGPRAAIQTAINDTLGIVPVAARAQLYVAEILSLDRKVQQRMILDLAGGQGITPPRDIKDAILRHLAPVPSVESLTLADLDALYKRAYDRRREVGQVLKGLGDAPAQPAWPDGVGPPTQDPRAVTSAIDGKLRVLRKDRDAIVKARGKADAAPAVLQGELDRKEGFLAEAREALAKLPSADQIAAQAKPLLTEYEDAELTVREIQEARNVVSRKIGEYEGRLLHAKSTLAAFQKLGSECPTCFQKLKAATKHTMTTSLAGAVEAAERDLQVLRGDLAAKDTEAPDLAGIRKRLAELEAVQDQRKQKKDAVARLETEVALLRDRIAAAAGGAEAAADTTEIDGRIAKGEQMLEAVREYMRALAAVGSEDATRTAAEAHHAELAKLVEALGPSGLRTQMPGGGPDAFEEEVQGSLKEFGFRVDLGPLLRLEDDIHVNGRPARMLSTSERLVFGIAFAVAIARRTKVGIVAVDSWELLDEHGTPRAQKILRAEGVEQVFLFATPKRGMGTFVGQAHEANGNGGGNRYFAVEFSENGSSVRLP